MQNEIQDESCFLCIFVKFIKKNHNSDQLNHILDQSNSSFTDQRGSVLVCVREREREREWIVFLKK